MLKGIEDGEMSSFDDAFSALISNEGRYSNNPDDPGGETMWGITARVARAWGYTGAMKDLPLDVAKQIAKREYWDAYQCDQFDPRIGLQVFDAAYNGGHPAQWLQQAAEVPADGVIGAITIAAVRAIDPMRIEMRFDAYRLQYLGSLPTWPSFGHGWANRIANNLLRGAA
jgi:lysozyme family protein